MQPNDFVFKQVFAGSLQAGATQTAANREALLCLTKYKRSQITAGKKKATVGDMIKWHIQAAKNTK